MRGVAGRGLLDLRIGRQAVPGKLRPQTGTTVGRVTKPVQLNRRGDTRKHDHCAVDRRCIAQDRERAVDTVAADHGDLNMLPLRKFYDERNQASMRQVSTLEPLADLDQRTSLN